MEEYTFFRFEVSIKGYPDDDGEAISKNLQQALLEAAQVYDIDADVKETTG